MVPLGEGPDEPGHFDYVLFVAREGRLPVQSEGAGEVPGEGHQPPLAYWLLQPAVWWLPLDERTLEMGPNPDFMPGGDEANAYLRSSRDIWPYSGIGRAWHLARVSSALLGGATVALTYAVARRCLPRQPLVALGAAALVAFNPQFVFAGALVSNDPLLFTLAAALLLVCVVLVQTPAAPRSTLALAAGAGVLLGLLLITKQSAVALAPLPFLALGLGGWRTNRPRDATGVAGHGYAGGTGRLWRVPTDATLLGGRGHAGGAGRLWRVPTFLNSQFLILNSVVAVLAAAIAGWWYARNLRLYGDLFGLDAFRETFAPGGGIALRGLSGGLWELFRSSWGLFGWLTVPLNNGYHSTMLVFAVLSLIGLLAAFGRAGDGYVDDVSGGGHAGAGHAGAGHAGAGHAGAGHAGAGHAAGRAVGMSLQRRTWRVVLLLAACAGLVFAWTAAFAAVAGAVAWQGRFLFPAIAALATGLAAGLAEVLPRRSALWTLVALLALASLAAPGGVIAPRYPAYVLPAQPADWGNTHARLSLPWKRGVELRNAKFAARAATGGTLQVTLTWHALEQLDAEYLVFVHLVDAAGRVVAESNVPPKGGRFPTSSWVRGDWIEQAQQLSLAGLAPGRYELYAGLWNREADRTLPVVVDGSIANWRHAIGWVEVSNR